MNTREDNLAYALENDLHIVIENAEFLTDVQISELVEANRYPNRRKDGLLFSDVMNARLNLLVAPDSVKDVIDTFFAQTQFFLEGGKWKSANREILKLEPIPHPQDSTQFIVSQDLIDEIKARITTYISENY